MFTKKKLLLPWYRYPPFDSQGIGGLSVSVWDTANRLCGQGVEVTVVTPNLESRQSTEGHGPRIIGRETCKKLISGEKLDSEDKSFLGEYDCILSVNNFGAASLRSLGSTVKIIRQIHTVARDRPISTYVSLRPTILEYVKMLVYNRRERRAELVLKGTKTICVSRYLSKKIVELGVEDERNVGWIPNGVDTAAFTPKGSEKIFDVLYVGRFQRVKGLDILLDCFRVLAERRELYTLGIIGHFDDDQRRYCLNKWGEEAMSKTRFLGVVQREDIPDVINSAKLLVVPSRYETFGIPVIEALACGVPVVATRVGGLAELVSQGVGKLVDSFKPADLADAISSTLKDDALQRSALVEGPKKATEFDWRKVAQRLSDAITEAS